MDWLGNDCVESRVVDCAADFFPARHLFPRLAQCDAARHGHRAAVDRLAATFAANDI